MLRGVEDGKAFQKGFISSEAFAETARRSAILNNTTTARDLTIILRRIKIMLDQKFNEGIPAGLPPGVRVSHKTGSITKVNHDAAIVYPPGGKPYVLVVLERGIEDEKLAHKLIADISRVVYECSRSSGKSAATLPTK